MTHLLRRTVLLLVLAWAAYPQPAEFVVGKTYRAINANDDTITGTVDRVFGQSVLFDHAGSRQVIMKSRVLEEVTEGGAASTPAGKPREETPPPVNEAAPAPAASRANSQSTSQAESPNVPRSEAPPVTQTGSPRAQSAAAPPAAPPEASEPVSAPKPQVPPEPRRPIFAPVPAPFPSAPSTQAPVTYRPLTADLATGQPSSASADLYDTIDGSAIYKKLGISGGSPWRLASTRGSVRRYVNVKRIGKVRGGHLGVWVREIIAPSARAIRRERARLITQRKERGLGIDGFDRYMYSEFHFEYDCAGGRAKMLTLSLCNEKGKVLSEAASNSPEWESGDDAEVGLVCGSR